MSEVAYSVAVKHDYHGNEVQGVTEMTEKETVIRHIREAFAGNTSPGDPFLQSYPAGYELAEEISLFKGVVRWEEVTAALLDANPDALSFFSEAGFRLFLPAYLIADINNELECVEPEFYLIFGFSEKYVDLPINNKQVKKLIGKSEFVNPIRYGAMTWEDHYRHRLSIFPREEAQAIVHYLNYKKKDNNLLTQNIDEIDAALSQFWLERAENAPTKNELIDHINADKEFVDGISLPGKEN